MTHDDIRRRLEAVEGLNWDDVGRARDEEYHGDWVRVGPVMMQSTDPNEEPWQGYPSAWPEERRREHRERARAERAEEDAVVEFLKHATTDLRQLLTEHDTDQQAQTRKETTVTNPIYGTPPEPDRGEPVRFLADAVEVLRPNGKVVRMDLVALADVAIGAERALAAARQEIDRLSRRVSSLENKLGRMERAGRILAGASEDDDLDEDLEDRVRALEQEVEQRRQDRLERREREDG